MGLDFYMNFIAAQHPEDLLIDFLPNFAYALILTRTRLGLLHAPFLIEIDLMT